MIVRLILLTAAIGVALVSQSVFAETRALVIGSDYTTAKDSNLQLANPIVDARIVAASLRRTSVDHVTLLEEPDTQRWKDEFSAFADSVQYDDIALVYFAGHGFQIDGANYLLSSDGTSLVALAPLVNRLIDQGKGVIVVIDACRDNPLAQTVAGPGTILVEGTDQSRSVQTVTLDQLAQAQSGLSQISNLRGQSALIFFSTEPGNVAEDGDPPGSGSIFARMFAREIRKHRSLNEVFRRISVRVFEATDGRQAPWRQGDLPFGVFISGMRPLPIP